MNQFNKKYKNISADTNFEVVEISWSSGEVAQVVVLQVQLSELSHVLHGGPLEFNQTVVRQAEDSEIFDSLQHASSQHFEAVVAQIEFIQIVGAE